MPRRPRRAGRHNLAPLTSVNDAASEGFPFFAGEGLTVMLRQAVSSLDLTTRLTLAVLALASGVYTYLGVRELLDGSAMLVFFAAIIYSAAVSVGIYAFWSFLMRFMPHVRDGVSRLLLFIAMGLGSVMIVAMSSWLNAAALAGSAALEQHLANKLETFVTDLDQAHTNALSAQSLLPDIQMASLRFAQLAEDERRQGSLTGTSGSGTVVQLLTQMSRQIDQLGDEVEASAGRVNQLYEQGGKHIARMRELVSARGPINPRADAFAGESMALMGVIASLQQTSVAPAVKRAAEDLARGFIAPIADGGSADLAERQSVVVGNVEAAVAAQSEQLAAAAEQILSTQPVRPERFEPLTTAEAVLRYAPDFLPSWAGAISIDLLPAVLVLILCVVHAGIRREGEPAAGASTMSAADLLTAMRILREVEDEGRKAKAVPQGVPERVDEPELPLAPPAKGWDADTPVPVGVVTPFTTTPFGGRPEKKD